MTVTTDEDVHAENGQSYGVKRKFKAWDDIYQDGKWVIPYAVHKKISNNHRAEVALNTAFEKLESNSSLKFVQRTDEERYLFFNIGSGCHSYIGQQKKTGPQDIILGEGCYYYFLVIHEVILAIRHSLESSDFTRSRIPT